MDGKRLGGMKKAPLDVSTWLNVRRAESPMLWWQFALLGTSGGVLVEVLAAFRCVVAWQGARRNRDGTLKRIPPKLGRYVDVPAHAIMLPARAALGAAAATLFGMTGQVTGPYGAVAFGCAAPVLLAQLGLIPQVERAVNRDQPNARRAKTDQLAAGTADVPAEESHLP